MSALLLIHCHSSSSDSVFARYPSIISVSFFLSSLLSSNLAGISGRVATSCIISVFAAVFIYSSSSLSARRCDAFSFMALFLVPHCACSFCFGISISLRCVGCIGLVSCDCMSIVIICVLFSHDSIVDFLLPCRVASSRGTMLHLSSLGPSSSLCAYTCKFLVCLSAFAAVPSCACHRPLCFLSVSSRA